MKRSNLTLLIGAAVVLCFLAAVIIAAQFMI